MKFTDLFNLNKNKKFWIFQLHYSKGVFQKGQSYIFPFLRSAIGWALTSFLQNRNQDQTLRAGIPCTD